MSTNFFLTLIHIIATIATFSFFKYFFHKVGEIKKVPQKRIYYILKSVQILISIIALVILGMIWSVSFSGMMVFASSIFAVIGVALFAQWSILSNLTSSIIIFFSFPARVGDTIKVIDGDNSIIGKIEEISLFQIELTDKDGNTVFYPNNLFLQKPIIKLIENQTVCKEKKIDTEEVIYGA